MTWEVPLLVEQPALDRPHAKEPRKRHPVHAEHRVRDPLHANVRDELWTELRQLQRVVKLVRELAVHAVPLSPERRHEEAKRHGFGRPCGCRNELHQAGSNSHTWVKAHFVEVHFFDRSRHREKREARIVRFSALEGQERPCRLVNAGQYRALRETHHRSRELAARAERHNGWSERRYERRVVVDADALKRWLGCHRLHGLERGQQGKRR